MQWDQSDSEVFDGCYRVARAAYRLADPDGPPPGHQQLLMILAEGPGSDRKETWFATGDDPGSVLGWYGLRFPDRENRHVGFLELCVDPEHRRRGIGTELLRHAAGSASASGRTALAGETFAGGAGEAFAKQVGANLGVVEARRLLDVTAIPPGRIAELRSSAATAASGYSLASWTGPVPEDRMQGYAYVRAAMNDAPSDYEDEHWDCQRVRDLVNPRIERSGNRRYTIVAIHDATGQTAAFTEIIVDPEIPGWGFQDNTGVARAHRGHRLGLLTKVAMLQWLVSAEPDLRKIITWNAAVNNHMIAINEHLGFEVLRPWVQDCEVPVATILE